MEHPSPGNEDGGRDGHQPFVNLVVLVVVLAFVMVAYWVFNALEHSRRFQRCLDTGRRNCVDFVDR
jgi:hypothetical protein